MNMGIHLDVKRIHTVLKESLTEEDFFCKKSRYQLGNMGFAKNEALMLLAHYKSKFKYGYDLSQTSVCRLLHLAKEKEDEAPLLRLCESPFFLVKACWLYEHAPYFLFYGKASLNQLDAFILNFATQYDVLFLQNKVAIDQWRKIKTPRRVMTTNFWEDKIFDPVSMIEKVVHENIEGIELCFDFHPFNYTKLLPEELSKEKREEIKKASEKSGIKIDMHSPIVGPYSPSPNPTIGKQLFFDPLKCPELIGETIDLAEDIGAGSLVVHLIDTSHPKKMADLIMKAAGRSVRIAVENYFMTKEPQTADLFIACVDEIFNALPKEVRKKNFGINLDVGHLNIEGDDPLTASEKIGRWCIEKNVFLRVHASDNYGRLYLNPPSYSADAHNNVSGHGINNMAIIKRLRSIGHELDVVAEQIQPLTPEDISTIHEAQSFPIEAS